MENKRKFYRKNRLEFRVIVFLIVLLLLFGVARRTVYALFPQKYSVYVEYYSDKYDLDPNLIYAVIRTESSFDASAYSEVGARGLMQITEDTFWWLKSKIASEEMLTHESLIDPELNIRFGTYYWACCLARYQNDISTAAASYFSGWGTVDNLLKNSAYSANGLVLNKFPYEGMNQYVAKINLYYDFYKKLYPHKK